MISFLSKKLLLSKKTTKKLIISSIYYYLIQFFTMAILGLYFFAIQEFIKPLESGSINMKTLYLILGLGLIYILIIAFLNYLHYDIYNAVYGESVEIRLNIADRLRKLPMSYFNKKNIADMTTLILKDCTDLEMGTSHIYSQFIGTLLSTFTISIFVFIYEWRFALSIFWIVPIVCLLYIFISKKTYKNFNILNESYVNVSNNFQEYIDTINEIKSYNIENKIYEKIVSVVNKHEKTMFKTEKNSAIVLNLLTMLLNIGVITSLITTTYLYSNKKIDFLKFIMLIIISLHIYQPYEALLEIGMLYAFIKSKIERIKNLKNEKIQNGIECPTINNYDIEFSNVSFSYTKKQQTIKNVSFIAKQGEITALIGPSGGGKTTIAKLATRFWDIDNGLITLGGNDISKIAPESLLKNYSMVFQDVLLFDMSIYDNIRIGKYNATKEEIYRAAKLAHCDEFVFKMPEGYQTKIGENGCLLSGGERQRISIARAILKDSPIIILDEATASLDVENETLLQDSLNSLIKNKTVIIIAHRMRTISKADKIIVIKNGEIDEIGRPEELINNSNSYFSRINKYQTETEKWTINLLKKQD